MSVWALLQVYLPGAARKRKGFDKGIPNELRSRVMAFELWRARDRAFKESCSNLLLESLILAQDERWRRA